MHKQKVSKQLHYCYNEGIAERYSDYWSNFRYSDWGVPHFNDLDWGDPCMKVSRWLRYKMT